jgi:hypothetical protein
MRDRDALANSALRRMQAPEDVKLLQEWFRNAQGQANVVAQPSGAPKDKKKEFGKGKVAPTPAAARRLEYPYQPSPSALGDTLLWHPNLYLNDGAGEVRFDIAPVQATYRVLLLGHSPTGRFGFFETRFDVPTIVDR